ncbi:hypothetical protein FACS189419_07010 [Planctomycetales bacterium]|nr:hypothetical protein FACS189419_07010 [Planctomycetales bacterium]
MKMTRRALYLFDRLASKLVKPSEQPAMVAFIPTNNGVYIASIGDNAAVSLFVLSKERITPFVVPLTLVKELAVSKSNDDVNFDVTGNTVTVHWYQDAIPNHRRHTFSAVPKLPPLPSKTTSHSKLLLDAITDASKVMDKDNARYALGAISLNGETGQIAATDGRQCLVQDGFKFAFQENALLPVSKIFTSKEFREAGENITLGFEKGLIYFSVGTVHLWYKSIAGAFPNIKRLFDEKAERTWIDLNDADARFLAERLQHLPGNDDPCKPVFIAFNENGVSVRGYDKEHQSCTEVKLSRSRCKGTAGLIAIDRTFIKNALDFGIKTLGFDLNSKPMLGDGFNKSFIAMPLETKEKPEYDRDKLNVVETSRTVSVPSKMERTVRDRVPVVVTTAARIVKPTTDTSDKPHHLLAEAECIRNALKTSLVNVNSLITEIKKHRRQEHLMRTTIESFKKLQQI